MWDMMDEYPTGYDIAWTVHGALWAYGVALVDNALLEPLVSACRKAGQWECQLVIAPLRIDGGTGSPVNPIATI